MRLPQEISILEAETNLSFWIFFFGPNDETFGQNPLEQEPDSNKFFEQTKSFERSYLW